MEEQCDWNEYLYDWNACLDLNAFLCMFDIYVARMVLSLVVRSPTICIYLIILVWLKCLSVLKYYLSIVWYIKNTFGYWVWGCSIPDNLYLIWSLSNVCENLSLNVVMDRSWINASGTNDVYMKCVKYFLEFAKHNGATINERYYYSCVNVKRLDIELIWEHVLCNGFLKNYTTWT